MGEVDMHCEACARKVARALKGFQGVENVKTDSKASKVVVKGKDADPIKPPTVITVVLEIRMHCDACAQALQKRIRKIQGVESVITDIANDKVIVKGVLDPDKLVNDVYKKTGKQASVVKDEPKKEEEKKDEEKKAEEKKDEKQDDKKQEEESKEGEDNKTDIKKSEYLPSKYYMEYAAYPPQFFSDENPNACSVM
ncbi:hypothetical protein BUALT_Bualt03G0091400 [Buddleja alternifolia]|uniref:HMA domain-containing protein n=1 Tax=Buddleja alternifolia TaxID=168488 RepID=A0AAV6Y331_9LAMI|nr:hypothetical protein BUALT_Bualt03G0091400 [Buddleja alternifolia]